MYIFFGKILTILGLRYPIKIEVENYYKNNYKLRPRTNSLDISSLGEIDPDKSIVQDDLEAIIDIECIRIPKFTDCYTNYKHILYWFYSVIIFCIIIVEPIFLLIKAIREKNLVYISNIAFLLISPLQHIIIIKYFRSQSFDKIY